MYTFKQGQFIVKGYQSVSLIGKKPFSTEELIRKLSNRELPLTSNFKKYCSFIYSGDEIVVIKLKVYNRRTDKTTWYVVFADSFDRPYLLIGRRRYYFESFVLE